MKSPGPAILLVGAALVAGGAWMLSGGGTSSPSTTAVAADPTPLRETVRRVARSDSTLPDPVRAYYTSEGTPLLWATPDARRTAALDAALERARAEGIPASELRAVEIHAALELLDEHAASEAVPDSVRATAELAASSALLRLADLHLRGVARSYDTPATADTPDDSPVSDRAVSWRIRRDSAPGRGVLADARAHGVHAALDSVRPLLPVYERTVHALATYRARSDSIGEWPKIDVPDDARVVEPGETAPVVREVRERLKEGMSERELALAARGDGRPDVLDADLAAAIAHFQRRHGVAVDSTVGPETIEAMNVPLADRIAQLRLNLDRMRRLPRDFGDRAVLVNVAGFELRVLEDNRPVMGMDVVVGQPSWRTRVFDDTIEHLVVNPYWHVPETIEEEEVLPRVREDPDYLADNRMSVVPADDNFGEPVDPETIDWSEVDAARMPWDFRQEPGPENSLGQVKFMFPNEHAIYLHDTPADELFRRNFRAFSHGCIRVERPWDLARWLLRVGGGPDADTLDALRRSGEHARVELDAPVPVYLTYLTTWVDEDGRVSFHRDVYDRDEALGVLDGEAP